MNWDCEETREKIFDIIRFWNEKGVDGYRVDAISYLDKGLDGRADFQEKIGTIACANLEGTHRYIREMAEKTFAPGHLVSVGEVNINNEEDSRKYSSAASGEFHMAIPFVPPIVEMKTWSPEKLKEDLERDYRVLKEDGWWARFFSNHDKPRQVSLYGNDTVYWKESAKMLACYLHTLPGTPFVYQGEELGMTNVRYHSIEEYDDIDTKNYYRTMLAEGASEEEALAEAQIISRDNGRTPMQWNDSVYAGFSEAKTLAGRESELWKDQCGKSDAGGNFCVSVLSEAYCAAKRKSSDDLWRSYHVRSQGRTDNRLYQKLEWRNLVGDS